jgi:ornithine cyclodeaminase
LSPPCLLLTERELRETVPLDASALVAVEESFTLLARGPVEMPMPMGIEIPEHEGEVHVKGAYVRGLPGFAVKIASGFNANNRRGLPTSSGMLALLSSETGFPLALLLDNAYLTDLRTALAGAVAARHLARAQVDTAGIVGTGVQARLQLEALRLVRPFGNAVVWGRNPEAAQRYAQEMSAALGLPVSPLPSVAEVMRRADVVVTTTPSRAPLIHTRDVHEGLHITAMGSDGPGKQELDPAILRRADRVVCDRKTQCFRLGELQHGLAAGTIREESAIDELGEITSGQKPGRRTDGEVTVCDLTGVGVQDTAIALFAYGRAREKGVGTLLGGQG